MKITYLKLERTKRNLKQKELAEKLDITRGYVSRIENLDYAPSKKVTKKIEEFFNMEIDHLLKVIDL